MKNESEKPQDQLFKIRHSLSHLMSMAVSELYPQVGLGVGPAIDDGFYQDYDLPESISPEILPKLEKRMRELIKEDIKFEQHQMSFEEALKLYKQDPYKSEMIKDLKTAGEKNVSFYKSGFFDNLCAGPHVKSTKEIDPKAFKLTRIAGAYWRGDEKNKMLTRIYGIAFASRSDLEEYIRLQEEAEKRDHRILGQKLDLFVFSDLVGKGLPLFTEKGATIRRELERYIVDEELKRGYKHVYTPDLAKTDLYKKSGHYPYYKDTMYPVMKVDEEELILRPMTCPHHFQLYLSRPRSYKELPIRFAELAKQFRYEKSGELTGLFRVRLFCLADAHIICRPDQANDEINGALDLIEDVAMTLGLKKGVDFRYRLSLGDRSDKNSKYYKDDKAWDYAENELRKVLISRKAPFFEGQGEAAFYGPKIDIQMKDILGKENTAFTVQYDFVMPKRFDLKYIDKDGKEKEAIVIHRSSVGALERVMAFMIEKYAGAFPVWLSPVQAIVLPISEKQNKYAKEVAEALKKQNVRVEVDDRNESVGKKIREAEMQKTPYMLVVGEKEVKDGTVAVRARNQPARRSFSEGGKDLGAMKLEKFAEKIQEEIKTKSL
ncbi:MAG: threonine--tRNA ligase [Candidatus Doudnabacteria bacterium]|nr:threonine--tRNA ligase [Candidatus Doudnabacteria bacterium]